MAVAVGAMLRARLFFRKANQDVRHLPPNEIVSDCNPFYSLDGRSDPTECK